MLIKIIMIIEFMMLKLASSNIMIGDGISKMISE